MYIVIYLDENGARCEGERFRSQRDAEAMLAYYTAPAWVEALIRL